MNSRILKMCHRYDGCRLVVDLGQLQPTLFAFYRHAGLCLSCEGTDRGRACLWRYPLLTQKPRAKAAFARLEHAKATHTDTDANQAWQATRRHHA